MGVPSQAAEDLLDVSGAHVRFGPLMAVRNVSLSLRGGDLLGLIGPNGAGKTTLLRAIAGLQSLTTGCVRVMGSEVRPGGRAVLRHIGFTPDTPPFYESMTVRDFLSFIARGYELGTEADERIDFWLEKVWLTEKAKQKISGLSRGMRQRVGIARTLLPNPHVVLLDEPAAGIDPAGRVQFRQLLCDLRAQGKALIVSSHILSDMSDYCTHVAMMSRGRLVQVGTVEQIVDAANANGRARYAVVLARPVAGLRDRLASMDSIHVADVSSDDRATLEFGASPDEAAALLSSLVVAGLPVASFAPVASDLEGAYLRAGIEQVD